MKKLNPKESFRYYVQARQEYDDQKYQTAERKLAQLAIITNNQDVNHLLVRSLYHLHKYATARELMIEQIDTYTRNRDLEFLMIRILLKNHDFIRSREVISSFSDNCLKTSLRKIIETAEKQESSLHSQQIKGLMNHFYHLAGMSLIKQRRVWQNSLKLPLKFFMKIARYLLVDPFLEPIMRLSILDTIRKMAISEQIRYRWFNGKIYSLNPSQLSELTQLRSYIQIMTILTHQNSLSPVNQIILKQNLRLELSYLYPFDDVVIRKPKIWVRIAMLIIKNEQPVRTDLESCRIYQLQQKLNRITSNLAH